MPGLSAYSGNFGKAELTHLLRRSLFGVKRSEVNALSGKSLQQVLDILLAPQSEPLPPINNYNEEKNDPDVKPGETWVNADIGDGVNDRRMFSFRSWWMGQVINRKVSLQEKMVLFMHNHLATEANMVEDARYLYKHNALLRKYALGNFRDLMKEVTIDPGMLKYLNGYLNAKNAPDENYARELQELFIIGKGPNSKYTEDDVLAAAKVLTGFRLSEKNINTYFDSSRHDVSNKKFSSFYGNATISGRQGMDGAKELDDLIALMFSNPEAALFICRKIYRFFGYYEITPEIEKSVIAPMAEIFRSSNYELKPVLRAFLGSDHFFSVETRSCHIKSPVDLCAGLCIEFEVEFPNDNQYPQQYKMWEYVYSQAGLMQQTIGDPPNVSGWPAYYQLPQFHELWINTDTLPKRNQYTDRLISSGFTRDDAKLVIDPIAYTSKFPKPEDPNMLIDDVLAHLYVIDVSAEVKAFLKGILLSNQVSDYYWTQAWTAYKNNPQNEMAKGIVQSHLQSMYKYIMNLEEYQLS